MRTVPIRNRVINGLTCTWNRRIQRWEPIALAQRCSHCEILIDPMYDEVHELETGDIVCDSCHNDYLVFGLDFGDSFYEQQLGWHECCHKQWRDEELAIREVSA